MKEYYNSLLAILMLQSINVELFLLINGLRSRFLDRFFLAVTHLGSGYIVISIVMVLYFVEKEKIWSLIVSYTLSGITAQLIKSFYRVERPAALLKNVYVIGSAHHYRSFPSGHTATAMALSYVLSYNEPLFVSLPLFCVALLVGYSRVYIGVHFPLDVFVGALVGVASGYIAVTYDFSLIFLVCISITALAVRYRSDILRYIKSMWNPPMRW